RIQQGNPRLDAHLIKPFRLGALEKILHEAYVHRTGTRGALFHAAPEVPAALANAFENGRKAGRHHWNALKPVTGTLAEAITAAARELGGLIFEPGRFTAADADWLAAFRKTPAGAAAQMACASRVPEEAFHLRNHCQFFADGNGGEEAWG